MALSQGQTAQTVQGIAKDSFGKVGKETGFSDALSDFAGVLGKQIKTTGSNADKLAEATTKAAKAYRAQEDDAIVEIKGADITSVLG